jgi:hypothetical protein
MSWHSRSIDSAIFRTVNDEGCVARTRSPPGCTIPACVRLCDRMGFLVMNEAFDEWKAGKGRVRGNGYSRVYDEWHERDVTDFVRYGRNHPSVVLWSLRQRNQRPAQRCRGSRDLDHRRPRRHQPRGGSRHHPADRRDGPLTAKVLDAQGRLHPDAGNEITFEVQGPGRLIGIDNGNMAEMAADFKAKSFPRCLAIVQSTSAAGPIRVSASSPGLKPGSVTITAASARG